MNEIKDCYICLAEAIVEEARREYLRAAKRLQKNDYVHKDDMKVDIAHYNMNRKFFINGCNGLVGMRGESVVDTINKKYGINKEIIERNIGRAAV